MLASHTVRRCRPATLDSCRVELSLLASHCCSAADEASHTHRTAQVRQPHRPQPSGRPATRLSAVPVASHTPCAD